jgi:hypothetical protein
MQYNSASPLMLEDVYSIWYEPWWQQVPVIKILVAVIIALLMLSIYLVYAHFLKLSYWYSAQKKIAVLIDKNKHNKLSITAVYIQLISVLKYYIEMRYNITVQNLTDTELLYYLKKIDTIDNIELLTPIIMHAEGIKFGCRSLEKNKIHEDLQHAHNFIVRSKPKK